MAVRGPGLWGLLARGSFSESGATWHYDRTGFLFAAGRGVSSVAILRAQLVPSRWVAGTDSAAMRMCATTQNCLPDDQFKGQWQPVRSPGASGLETVGPFSCGAR